MIDLTNKYYTDDEKARVIMGCKETEERLREHNINEQLITKLMKEYESRFISVLYKNK